MSRLETLGSGKSSQADNPHTIVLCKIYKVLGKKKKKTLRDKRGKCHLSRETPTQSTEDPKAGPEGEVVREGYRQEITA